MVGLIVDFLTESRASLVSLRRRRKMRARNGTVNVVGPTPQMNAVLTFVLSEYLGGASRVRWPIRLTSSLKDLACGFVLPAL